MTTKHLTPVRSTATEAVDLTGPIALLAVLLVLHNWIQNFKTNLSVLKISISLFMDLQDRVMMTLEIHGGMNRREERRMIGFGTAHKILQYFKTRSV